jgi:hypothetical protein
VLSKGPPIEIVLDASRYMPDVQSAECPRSRSARGSGPWATQMVEEIHKAKWIKEGSGAFPGGSNVDDWDCKFHDAFYLVEVQRHRVEAAENEIKRQY